MPGRIVRGARAAAGDNSASTTASSLKPSRRTSSAVISIPDEGADTSLRHEICSIFSGAQKTTATHRKLVVKLRKIQEACCYEPITAATSTNKKGKSDEEYEEEDFNREIIRCVLRVLAVRKAEPAGDRVVRFLGTYLNSASAKDAEIAESADPDATSLAETPTARLTTQLLEELLRRLDVKDKTIRFRATQITSHIINSLDALDDTLFHRLRVNLLKRIHDKEAPVRLQAVYGLGRLAAEADENEDDDEDDSDNDGGAGVLKKLLNVLQNDPSAEVRRNLLLNLPLTKEVLPYLLERARDADGQTRRALYARLLPALGDFRHLSLTHREKLLRWGLRDRDENVRKATGKLFRERWIEDCAALPAAQAAEKAQEGLEAEVQEQGNAKQAADPSLDALLELLERIDVVNSGNEGGIALVAMKEFWDGRPDYVDYVSFPDEFWQDLNPELAFVARTFNDHCRGAGAKAVHGLAAIAEEKLPELTKFGFYLERSMNKLIETVHNAALGDEQAEEDAPQAEFVVEQLLNMALLYDYSDEVGRRKIFALMREALALADLPEECTRLVVEVLRLVCGEDARGEADFCTVVLEAVAEVHDVVMSDGDSSVDESFHSATTHVDDEGTLQPTRPKTKKRNEANATEAEQDKAMREIMVNMKCLHIALCMLQNVACDLEGNVHLVTMLNNLVVPAVRSQEAPIRERGLLCLGLCCLLGKNLAEENLTLFLHCFAKGHPALQVIALQIIADILITHPSLLADPPATEPDQSTSQNDLKQQIIKVFSKSLKSDDAGVQSTGAAALSKMMLSQLITDTSLLKNLVVAYFDPETRSNASMQQGLTYFLPVYCHSRAENARRMAEVACPVLTKLSSLRESLQDDADADEDGLGTGDMVTPTKIAQMLLEWTDPRKIVGFTEATSSTSANGRSVGAAAATEVHFILADRILERLVYNQVSRDEKKVLFTILGKLHLSPDGCDEELLKSILTSVTEAMDGKVAADATSKTIVNRLRDQLLKMMNRIATAERGGGGAEETVLVDKQSAEADDVTVRVCDEETKAAHNIMGDDDDPHGDAGAARQKGKGEEGEEEDVDDDDGNDDNDDDDAQDDQTTLSSPNMENMTVGATSLGMTLGGNPDAEGTRIMLGPDEDVDMMDVDYDEYTEVSEER